MNVLMIKNFFWMIVILILIIACVICFLKKTNSRIPARFTQILARAEKGDVEAMYMLSHVYRIECKDKEKYMCWLEKAGKAGNAEAMEELGVGYTKQSNEDSYNINSIMRFGYSKEKAIYWLSKAVKTNHARAFYLLGDYYIYDEGDYEKGFAQYELAYIKGCEQKDWRTVLYVAALLADRSDMMWILEQKESEFEKADKYYSRILLQEVGIDDDIIDYPRYYVNAAAKLGLMYHKRYVNRGMDFMDGRKTAYLLFLAMHADKEGYSRTLIKESFGEMKSFISDKDIREWKKQAKEYKYFPEIL